MILLWLDFGLITVCLNVYLFEFILIRVPWGSQMFIFISFIKLGKFSAIIPSYVLSAPFSLPLLELWQCICWSAWWCLTYRFLRLSSLVFSHFSLCSSNSLISIVLFKSADSLSIQICLWILWWIFHLSYHTFQIQNFFLVSYFLIDISLLFILFFFLTFLHIFLYLFKNL